MAKFRKPNESKTELSQTINLKEVFGINFSGKEDLKKAIGQAIIDKIVARTKEGIGVSGRKLKSPYSKEYSESLEFKAAGKSEDQVNLSLTGNMLRSIDVLDTTANQIKIGINDETEAAKAYNHQTGDSVPKRRFFGVTNKLLNEVKSEFRTELKEINNSRGDRRKEKISSLVNRILDDGES